MPAIDNALYSRLAATWWEPTSPLYLLRAAMNPVRLRYFRGVLTRHLPRSLPTLALLDLGCGGGLLTEALAAWGSAVTGLDPSVASVQVARGHWTPAVGRVAYVAGVGEALPFPDHTFDVVVCSDVLEHVTDLATVVREAARVLRPGGVFVFDTINRTLVSWLVLIQAAQRWPPTRILPRDLHVWSHFVPPAVLDRALRPAGLRRRGRWVGFGVAAPPWTVLRLVWQLKQGRISYATFGRRLHFRPVRGLYAAYAGYALKG